MPIRDDIDAIIRRTDTTPTQKGADIARVKSRALADEFTRISRQNTGFMIRGVLFKIVRSEIVENDEGAPWLRATITAKNMATGEWILTEHDRRNPFYWRNPPISIVTGSVPNPRRIGSPTTPEERAINRREPETLPRVQEDVRRATMAIISDAVLGRE